MFHYFQVLYPMEENSNFILVPWDFTKISENALLHGIKIAKMTDEIIVLQHIVDKSLPDEKEKKLEVKLENVREKFENLFGVSIQVLISKGNIFSAISNYANKNKASMVIMGTHGMKGMQKITGSWALKVIAGSKVPFIVVQDKPGDWDKFKDIVFPVDFRKENKDKLRWAIFMGKYFDSKVHILKSKEIDKKLVKKTNTNLNIAIKYLIQNRLDYEICELPLSPNLAKDTLAFAQDINADLILITTTKNINPAKYLLGVQEQYIIANSSKIPVMCINP